MRYPRIILITLLLGFSVCTMQAVRFSTMDAAMVSELVEETVRSQQASATAKGADTDKAICPGQPIHLNAEDMVTKVYGIVSHKLGRRDCANEVKRLINISPEVDQQALWLEGENGNLLEYNGMSPYCSAMAQFVPTEDSDPLEAGNERLLDYCFFFLFPYDGDSHAQATASQTEFCGALLQEMHDLGVDFGINPMSDDLFQVNGPYAGNLVDMRLLDDPDGQRFILMLSVEPDAFTPADDILADETTTDYPEIERTLADNIVK